MVEEVGSSVSSLTVGDRVMVPFNVYCGSCWFCARGLFSNCHNVNPNATAVGGIYGYSTPPAATTADRQSGFVSRSRTSVRRSSPSGWTPRTRSS